MIKLLIFGPTGSMGRLISKLALEDNEIEVVAACDVTNVGDELGTLIGVKDPSKVKISDVNILQDVMQVSQLCKTWTTSCGLTPMVHLAQASPSKKFSASLLLQGTGSGTAVVPEVDWKTLICSSGMASLSARGLPRISLKSSVKGILAISSTVFISAGFIPASSHFRL